MVASVFYASEAFGMYRHVETVQRLHRRTKEENDKGKFVL